VALASQSISIYGLKTYSCKTLEDKEPRLRPLFDFMCVYVLDTVLWRFFLAPRLEEFCELVTSTNRSLSFRWRSAKDAMRYHFVGHSLDLVTNVTELTVDDLDPGRFYSFTLWAVGSTDLRSNSITCKDSTGLQSLSFFVNCCCLPGAVSIRTVT